MEYEGHRLRHEFKYYIGEADYRVLRSRFRAVVERDENMEKEEGYLISSLYFDDVRNSAMEEKIAGTRFRKKFRIRVYERSDKVIKLECKMKYDSLIAKVSAPLSRQEYDLMLGGDYDFLLDRREEVCREVYMLHRTSLLLPAVVVEYRREAYVSRLGNVRLTFDKEISASLDSLDMLGDACPVTEVLPRGVVVLEVKYDDYLPEYLRGLLQMGRADKCAISKYVMCRRKGFAVKQR